GARTAGQEAVADRAGGGNQDAVRGVLPLLLAEGGSQERTQGHHRALLRTDATPEGKFNSVNLHQIGQRIVTTERELAIVNYVRRRLAFLVADDALFNAIDRVEYKDYVGKLAIYYDKES